MSDWLSYEWIKAFHIIAVIAWMAGMLYLPRLFVYHCDAAPGSPQSETFKTMEQRLLKFIMLAAMMVTWILGIVLVLLGQWFGAGWFIAKLGLVIAMTLLHGAFTQWANDFGFDRNRHSAKFYRIANEIPTVMLIVIVNLAVVKPF